MCVQPAQGLRALHPHASRAHRSVGRTVLPEKWVGEDRMTSLLSLFTTTTPEKVLVLDGHTQQQ